MKHKRITHEQAGEINLMVVALVVMTVAAFAFAIMAIFNYSKASSATKSTNTAKAQAYELGKTAGANAQKTADVAAAKAEVQNPYRSYDAPVQFGKFSVRFPKNWSSWVREEQNNVNQVDFIANPDLVKVLSDGSVNYALRVTLVNQPYAQVKLNYDAQVKSKKATAKSVTVFGLDGTRYEGKYNSTKSGVIVLVPVRDKTIAFATENTKYLPEFEQILTQSTINP